MVYGSASVMPSGSGCSESGDTITTTDRTTPGLLSVQSDPSVIGSRPSSPKFHRRHKSMFSTLSSGGVSEESMTKTKTTMRIGSSNPRSNRTKWDWKLSDFWYSRNRKSFANGDTISTKTTTIKNDLVQTDVVVVSSTISEDIAIDDNKIRDSVAPGSPSQASLHYTSLGIFASSKFSSSDLGESNGPSSTPSTTRSDDSVDDEGRVPSLATRWREIQGERDWEGLIEPLDLDLRKEILRYGDLAQMAYDNFQDHSWSKYAGSARFSKKNVFEKLHKGEIGYQVTRYLYATCENPLPGFLQSSISDEKWDVESNWMGFVAVAVDEQEIQRLGRRDIVVSWRGTSRPIEWLVDAQVQLTPMTAPDHLQSTKPSGMKPKVEKGFWRLYTCKRSKSRFNQKSASEQVMRELTRLLSLYKGETLSITLTGHSLGGALAVLTAYDIAERGLNTQTANPIPVTVFSFGSPRVGDAVFKRRFESLNLKALRVVNLYDVVPKAIGGLQPPWNDAFKHVGVELPVNSKLSPYLRPGSSRDLGVCHSLECYLHYVDGHQGLKSKAFRSETGRDPALVNKYLEALKGEYCVPAWWWQEENKGLVLNAEGRWTEPDRALEDVPSLENRDNFI